MNQPGVPAASAADCPIEPQPVSGAAQRTEPKRERTAVQAPAEASQRRRVGELDALRGIGAVIVVWAHVRRDEVFWSWTLMEMFFVLSAALLSSIVWGRIRTGADVVRFYFRRAERIWPAYMITVAGVTLLCIAFKVISTNDYGDPLLAWRYFTFSQYSEQIFDPEPGFKYWFFARHLWSLAIEEQFYIALPMLCLLVFRLRTTWQLCILGALLIGGFWARLAGAHYYAITAHVDGFILGAMIALALPWLRSHLDIARKLLGTAMLIGGASLVHYLWVGYGRYFAGIDPFVYDPLTGAGAVIFWGGAVTWLMLHSGAQQFAWMRHALPGYLGRISYTLYLVHYPILTAAPYAANWMARRAGIGELPEWSYMPFAVALSFALAHLLYIKLDKPLQDKGWKSRPQTPGARPADSGA